MLDELIKRVEKKGEREVLTHVTDMALSPFQERWNWSDSEEERFCGNVPKHRGMLQCSCSS